MVLPCGSPLSRGAGAAGAAWVALHEGCKARWRSLDLLRLDPTTFLWSYAGWSLLMAASLLAPGRVFNVNPVYWSLRATGIPEQVWGVATALNGLLLVLSILHPSGILRFVVGIGSGVLWFYLGVLLLLGGLHGGFFSAAGGWCICGGCGCFLAAVQWSVRGGGA